MTSAQLTIRLPLALLISFATFEMAARIDDRFTEGAPWWGRYDQSVLFTQDSFGIAGKPGAHFGKWRLNSLGFRGPELVAGSVTVLCAGASETFGLYEPEGREFPRQLEAELNRIASEPSYQVINAALPGQSLGSFARRAPSILQRDRPKIVVIYPSLAMYIDPPPEEFTPDAMPRGAAFRLRIAGKLFELLDSHIPRSLRNAAERASIAWRTRHSTVFDRLPPENVMRFRADLSHLLDILKTRGVPAVLVTHATRFREPVDERDRPLLTAWRALYPALREAGFMDMEQRLNNVIREESKSRGTPLVDAAQWLHGSDNFAEFVHFTSRGAGLLARAIATAVQGAHVETGTR